MLISELPIRFNSKSTSQHHLFIKEDDLDASGKTLFIINIPPYATEESISRIFSKVSPIKSVSLQKLDKSATNSTNGFQQAHITFDKPISLKLVLKKIASEVLSSEEMPIQIGVPQYINEYNHNIEIQTRLREEVVNIIKKYDQREEHEKNKNKKGDADEDGWTVVGKKGRNPGISRKESVENSLLNKMSEKNMRKELTNFYRFQIKESKMNHLANLKKQFEEDKRKINMMKQSRKFKPY